MRDNVGCTLLESADRAPDHVALIDVGDGGRSIGFGTLADAALGFSAWLHREGVRSGERVALVAGNHANFVRAWFGVVLAGASIVPLSPLSAPLEIRERVARARCKLVLVDVDSADLARRSVPDTVRIVELDTVPFERGTWTDVRVPDEHAGAMVLFTSGTTGIPRGAVISHRSLYEHTLTLVRIGFELRGSDRVFGALPLVHSFGCRSVMLASVIAGARFVLVPRFRARESLDVIAREGVTWVPAVPTMFAAWGRLERPVMPLSVRGGVSAGAPLTDDTVLNAERILGAPIRQGYGLTEATFCTLDALPMPRTLGSAGRAVPGVDVRVVRDDGLECARGTPGEIVVRGANTMTGYLDDPEATARAHRDGWFATGDVGVMDADGLLRVIDRAKDMIIRSGHNVYPFEVENALGGHADVAHVCVVGREDARVGEEIVAVIVARQGTVVDFRAVVAHASERIARTKLPREYAIIDALPVGATGKVLRRELRERIARGELVPRAAPRDTLHG